MFISNITINNTVISILRTVLIIGTSRITRLVAVCGELNQTHAKCRVALNIIEPCRNKATFDHPHPSPLPEGEGA
jgi:hypothetical protein